MPCPSLVFRRTESLNGIEGATISSERFKELMLHPTNPIDRSESEVLEHINPLNQLTSLLRRIWIKDLNFLAFFIKFS